MTAPTLSVVMPNYNHSAYLPRALQALINEPYPTEIIVLDDCSTDDSVAIIESFVPKDPRLRLVRNEKNIGVNASVTRLCEMAASEYVCSTAADDRLLPTMLDRSMRLLAQYPQAGLCSTMSYVIDAATEERTNIAPVENIVEDESYIKPDQALRWLRGHDSWIMGNTVVYRRQALLEAGGFIPELHAYADGFIQVVLALKYGVCFIPEPLAEWRVGAGGYAVQSVSNVNVSLKMWSHAAQLMRTTYRDLFPRAYTDRWEKQRLYHARMSALNRRRKERLAGRDNAGGNGSLASRIGSTVEFLVGGGLLTLASAPAAVPVLRRNIKSVVRGRALRRSLETKEPAALRQLKTTD